MFYTDILEVLNKFFSCVDSIFSIYQNNYTSFGNEILYLTFNGILEQKQQTSIVRIREKFVTNTYISFSLVSYEDVLEEINNYVVT